MSSYVAAHLRRLVLARSGGVCEYCLIDASDTVYGLQVEHIISEKHGGQTTAENLSAACPFCNRYKGSDIAGLTPGTRTLLALYHPRNDSWTTHFRISGVTISGVTPVGETTAQLLLFNVDHRLSERELLVRTGRYPSPAAVQYLKGRLP